MINSTYITVSFITPFFKCLEDRGIPAEKLCSLAGLDVSILKKPQEKIFAPMANRLVAHIIRLTGEESIGLHIYEKIHIEMAGMTGFLMLNCLTLGDAIAQYAKYKDLVGNIVQMSVRLREGDNPKIIWTYNPDDVEYPRTILETVAVTAAGMIRELSEKKNLIEEIRFNYPEPEYSELYHEVFRTKIVFNAPENAVVFGKGVMYYPVRQPDPMIFSMIQSKAEEALMQLSQEQSIGFQTRMVMANDDHSIPEIKIVARKLKMNTRQLQLKLKEEGISYRQLRDSILFERAAACLRKGYTINEIARYLGFSESGAFHRSFRRWSGLTPKAFLRINASKSLKADPADAKE
jgi:AraC-like DNA-binding protein